jgi:hypothetical protein
MLRRLSCLVVLSALIAAACSSDGGATTASTESAGSSTVDVSTTAPAPADPTIHVVTIAKGVATVTAADGSVTTIDLPKGFSPLAAPTIGRWLIDGDTRSDTLTSIDLRDGTVSTVPLGDVLTVRKESIRPGSDVVVVDDSSDYGSVAVVDLSTGTVTHLGQDEAEYSFTGQSGADLRYQAIDRTSTVFVPLDDILKAATLQGVVVDRLDDHAVTLLPAGNGQSFALLVGGALTGQPLPLTPSVRGASATSTGANVVDSTGRVSSIDFTTGEVTPIGEVGNEVKSGIGLGGGRMLATWDTGAVLIDDTGTVLTDFPERPGTRLLPVWRGSKCALLQPATMPALDGAGAVLLDVESATVLHLFDATPSPLSADGCDVLSSGNPSELFLDGELVDTGLYHLQAVTADGNWAIGNQQDDTAQKLFMDVRAGTTTPLPGGIALLAVFDPA